jgi:DeoR/GlpR family transcriptional regulator of sugar metabolism
LIEGGMSQRQAAKTLGTSQSTIRRDLNLNGSQSEPKRRTGSAATKAPGERRI